MSKQSATPWNTDDGMDTNGRKTLVFDDANLLVCDCAPGFTAADWETGGDEAEANARLLASAPDLLAALEDMMPLALAHLKSLASTTEADDDDTEDGLPSQEKWELSRRYYAAKEAIARATSE